MGSNLYVGNLSFETTEGELLDLFQQIGEVKSCSLILDRDTGNSRGFAFVEMATREDGQKAISDLDGKDLDGRALKVNEARPRGDRPGGGGGHGRGNDNRSFSRNRY